MRLGLIRYHLREALAEALRYARGDSADRRFQQREWFYKFAGRFTPVLAVDTDLGRVHVATRGSVIGMETFVRGSHDRDVIETVLAELERHAPGWQDHGDVIVEVGANIGTTSLILARYGPVVAFEPVHSNLALLRQNVAANDLQGHVVVTAAALSDTPGTVEMEISPGNCGDHRVRVTTTAGFEGEENRSTVHVRAARFDDELAGRCASLVWMDAQGHEAHVLAGAPTLLASRTPVVIEYWPYGLERSGGLGLLERLVAENFAWVVDTSRRDPSNVTTLPASALPSLRARYSGYEDYTDLLLLH